LRPASVTRNRRSLVGERESPILVNVTESRLADKNQRFLSTRGEDSRQDHRGAGLCGFSVCGNAAVPFAVAETVLSTIAEIRLLEYVETKV
jgi:hypothetical protein